MDFQTLNMLLKSGMDFGHRRIRSFGLSDTELMICSFVHKHTGCSQDDVVRGLRIDKTTAAKAMRRLEEKGLLDRAVHQKDRRKKVLTVTQSGVENLNEIMHLHDTWLGDILPCLTEEEQEQFSGYCSRLLAASEDKLEELYSEEEKQLRPTER